MKMRRRNTELHICDIVKRIRQRQSPLQELHSPEGTEKEEEEEKYIYAAIATCMIF